MKIILFIAVILALSGCRYRIYLDEAPTPIPEEDAYEYEMPEEEPQQEPQQEEQQQEQEPAETHMEAEEDDTSPLIMEVVYEDARQYATEAAETHEPYVAIAAAEEEHQPNDIVTLEEPAEAEGEAVIGDDGGIVGVVRAYSALLSQGINTMFPCQLFNIYCETAEELVTVQRGSDLYRLMVDAGGMNVSSRLAEDRLNVTADWVVRRNPDIIVKFVNDTVLGSGITSTYAAAELRREIAARPGWGAIEAVQHNRIILLSEDLLGTDEARLAAKLSIARLMYPELFENIAIASAISELVSSIGGVLIYG